MSPIGPFGRILLLASFTMLLLALGLAGPFVVSRLLHDRHMPDHDPLLVCFLVPAFHDGAPLLLNLLATFLFALMLLLGVASTGLQWYRTRCMTRSVMKFASPVAQEVWFPLVKRLRLQGKVDFVSVDRPVAFCYGWLRPRILLARGAVVGLDEEELAALLLHERYHLMQRDPLRAALAKTLSLAFFFLPAVRALHEEYLVAREIDADRYVLRNQESVAPLLGALCKLILRSPRRSGRELFGTAGAADCLNQRLDHLLSGRAAQETRTGSLLVSGAVLVALVLVATLASWDAASNAIWHQTACSLGTCPLMP